MPWQISVLSNIIRKFWKLYKKVVILDSSEFCAAAEEKLKIEILYEWMFVFTTRQFPSKEFSFGKKKKKLNPVTVTSFYPLEICTYFMLSFQYLTLLRVGSVCALCLDLSIIVITCFANFQVVLKFIWR